VYEVKGFDIILGKHLVRDINGTYHIDHPNNKMWITKGGIPWDDREMPAWIRYLRSLRPDSIPDDDNIQEADRAIGIKSIGQKQLRRMNHRVLARVFMV